MKPQAIDLCAGAGGASIGFASAGFDVLGVESDDDAVETHRLQVGPCDQGDIREWHPHAGYRASVVGGGVPCQSFSQSGKRLGLLDPRGDLYLEVIRIARENCAEAVWIENSAGITTWRDAEGRQASTVISDAFRENGWLVQSTVLDAAEYGVPQHRRRWIMVGFQERVHFDAFQWPEATHGAQLTARHPYVTVREALRPWLEDPDAPDASTLDMPSPTITAGGTRSGGRHTGGAEPLANAKPRKSLLGALGKAGLLDRPATTVSCDPRLSVAGHRVRQQAGAVRLLPVHCQVLQGFPAEMKFSGKKGSQHAQIGNAFPPPLADALAQSLWAALGF